MQTTKSVLNSSTATMPVDQKSATWLGIFSTGATHPDFGNALISGTYNGIPVNFYSGTPRTTVKWSGVYGTTTWSPGPYLIPPNAIVEGSTPSNPNIGDPNGDRHLIVVDKNAQLSYELIGASPNGDGTWTADAGIIWDLTSDAELPPGNGSACAYGGPMAPILADPSQIHLESDGTSTLGHIIGVNLPKTSAPYRWPADADAQSNPSGPPMGTIIRLKASYDISKLQPQSQAIARTLQKYGGIVFQNGGSVLYINGTPGGAAGGGVTWNDSDINDSTTGIKSIPWPSAFEFVNVSGLEFSPSTFDINPNGPTSVSSTGPSGTNTGSASTAGLSTHTHSDPRAR
jgi:hypothetical protein